MFVSQTHYKDNTIFKNNKKYLTFFKLFLLLLLEGCPPPVLRGSLAVLAFGIIGPPAVAGVQR